MDPITLMLLSAASLFVLKSSTGYSARGSSSGSATKGSESRRKNLNMIREMSFWYSNQYNSMPYLADYFTVIGYRESKFSPTAVNPEVKTNPANAARGLFGMRPQSAFTDSNGLAHLAAKPNLLYDPRWAFVTAVDYAYRGCRVAHVDDNRTPDWAGIRRWWAIPSLIHDYDNSKSKSKEVISRLQKALKDCNEKYGTTIDPNFIWKTVDNWDNYPGVGEMMKAFGLGAKA